MTNCRSRLVLELLDGRDVPSVVTQAAPPNVGHLYDSIGTVDTDAPDHLLGSEQSLLQGQDKIASDNYAVEQAKARLDAYKGDKLSDDYRKLRNAYEDAVKQTSSDLKSYDNNLKIYYDALINYNDEADQSHQHQAPESIKNFDPNKAKPPTGRGDQPIIRDVG